MNEYPFEPINSCIYCQTEENLSDEHIIPYSLDGTYILPKSSCLACANITKKFEQTCSRTIFGNFRIIFNLKTRRKKKRPTHLPLKFIFKNRAITRQIAIEDYPNAACLLPEFDYPEILSGKKTKVIFRPFDATLFNRDERLKKLYEPGLLKVESIVKSDEKAFGRLLAKIAHGIAVARCGKDSFTPLLNDIILGKKDNHRSLVGNFPRGGQPIADPNLDELHDVILGLCANSEQKVVLVAGIELFRGGTIIPPYCVVIGIPTKELIDRLMKNGAGTNPPMPALI